MGTEVFDDVDLRFDGYDVKGFAHSNFFLNGY